jgi:hypothetical protein
VGKSGNFQTIQSAVDQVVADAPASAVIMLEGQNYTENIVIPSTVASLCIQALGTNLEGPQINGSITVNGGASTALSLVGLIISPPTGLDAVTVNGGFVLSRQTFLFPDGARGFNLVDVAVGQTQPSLVAFGSVISNNVTVAVEGATNTVALLLGCFFPGTISAAVRMRNNSVAFAMQCAFLPGSGVVLDQVDSSFMVCANCSSTGEATAAQMASGAVSMSNSSFECGGQPAVTISGSANLDISLTTLRSTAAPFVIVGNPAATMGYGLIVFPSGSAIDPAITQTAYTIH